MRAEEEGTVNVESVKFDPRVFRAMKDKDLSTLKDLLSAHPEIISVITPFAAGTWLHFAAGEGFAEAVTLLLKHGANVNAGDAREGRAAICDAANGGHFDIVKILFAAGSILDTSDSIRNPLFAAIYGRSIEIVNFLLENGINPKVAYTGSSMKNMDAIAFAMERGERDIAMHIAKFIARGDMVIAEKLLRQGDEIAAENNRTS